MATSAVLFLMEHAALLWLLIVLTGDQNTMNYTTSKISVLSI